MTALHLLYPCRLLSPIFRGSIRPVENGTEEWGMMKTLILTLVLASSAFAQTAPTPKHSSVPKKSAAPQANLSPDFIARATRAKDAISKDTFTFNITTVAAADDRIAETEKVATSPSEKSFTDALKSFRLACIETNLMVKTKRVTYEMEVERTVAGRRSPEFDKEVENRVETDRGVANFRIAAGDCGDALTRILESRTWTDWPKQCQQQKKD